MARTRKSIQPLNLYKYDVLIEDRGPRSDYFKVSQFDGYFYGGRNAFLIAGAGILRPNTKILVEILSVDGTTVYSAPATQFVEGNSRLIQVEVYNDTPIGAGKLVIMGCAQTYIDGTPVPDEWKEKLNVRWITDVIISPLIQNKTPIRFVSTPSVVVEEKFYKIPSSSLFTEKVLIPVNVQLSPKYYNVFHNGYQIKLLGPPNTEFISEYETGILTGSVAITNGVVTENAVISLPINKIFNGNLAESEGTLIYTDKNKLITDGIFSSSGAYTTYIGPIGTAFISSSINLQYSKLETFSTGSSISYAKLRVVDAKTLSGEINKIRISYKIATEPGDYVVLSDVDVGVQELLTIDSSSRVVETGIFKDLVINDYWYTATMSLQKNENVSTLPAYYQSSSLIGTSIPTVPYGSDILDGINVTPQIVSNTFINNVSYFIGTRNENPIELFPRSEYTLAFDAVAARASASVQLNQSDYSLEVYLVPQENSTSKLLSTDVRGQLIGTLTPSSNFIKQNFERVEFNFTPKIIEFGEFGLRFVVYGGNWSVANISVKPAQEPFFSPDEFDILVPNVNYTDKILSYKVQYLDINNNSVGVSTLSIPTYFTGSDITAVGFLTTSSIATVVDTYTFVGDGTTTQYQVSSSYDDTSLLVAVGGVTYISPDDYYISSSTVIFTEPPTSASNVSIKAIVNVTENAVGSFSGSFVGSFTGSMFGTSSWAQNVISSSYATTSSAATSITFTPSTASFATTASTATSITFIPPTASFATSASFSTVANNLNGGTTNYIPMWISTTEQSSSTIYQNGANIGIGTTNPAVKLDVRGTIYTTDITWGYPTQTVGQLIRGGSGLADLHIIQPSGKFRVINSAYSNELFVVNEIGSFYSSGSAAIAASIGTGEAYLSVGEGRNASGYAYLDLVGDTTYNDYGLRIIRNNAGANTTSNIIQRGTGELLLTTAEAAAIVLQTTNIERVRILAGGNVGIGTTNPLAKLEITSGNLRLSQAHGGAGSFGRLEWQNILAYSSTVRAYIEGRRGTNDDGYIDFATSDNTNIAPIVRMTVNNLGDVGIGTSSPAAKLHVTGDISASLIFVSGTLGQPLTQTSSSVALGEYIYDTGIPVTTLVPDGPAVYELLAQYNPNTAGSPYYRNILHGHIYIEDGWNGIENIVTVEYNELYRAIGSGSYDGSGANVNVSFVSTAGAATNTEQITLPYASGSWQLRIRFSDNSTSPGTPSYRIVRLLRKL